MTYEYVIYGCGSGIFIPDPEFSILDPGSKKHRIPSSDPRQRVEVFSTPKNDIIFSEI
jgi:hypothetical protein